MMLNADADDQMAHVSLIWSRTRCMVIEQVYTNSKQLLRIQFKKKAYDDDGISQAALLQPSDWLDSRMQLDSGLYNDPVSL